MAAAAAGTRRDLRGRPAGGAQQEHEGAYLANLELRHSNSLFRLEIVPCAIGSLEYNKAVIFTLCCTMLGLEIQLIFACQVPSYGYISFGRLS